MANICVYLGILKPLLQVVVDCFVGDFADEREIRHSDLLLLGALKDSTLDRAFVSSA
jgi:hypothetical protein